MRKVIDASNMGHKAWRNWDRLAKMTLSRRIIKARRVVCVGPPHRWRMKLILSGSNAPNPARRMDTCGVRFLQGGSRVEVALDAARSPCSLLLLRGEEMMKGGGSGRSRAKGFVRRRKRVHRRVHAGWVCLE